MTLRKRTTYQALFAIGEFRVLFSGTLLYVLGFEFEILGLSVLVYARTRSSFLAALAFSIGFLPQVAGGLLLTSLAERLAARTVIAAGLLARSAPGLLIGLWPVLPIWLTLVMVAAAAMLAPVFSGATAGLLPEMLDGDLYVLGRSVFSLTGSSAQILGLGIGGAIIATLSARWLLLMAGVSLVAGAIVAHLGLPRRAGPAGAARIRGVVRASMAGNAQLLADRRVRGLLLAQWLPVWFVTGAESLIVPYVGALRQPSSAAGPLLAALPAGMLLGNLTVGRLCRPAARQHLVFPLALLMGLPLLAFGFSPPLPAASAALLFSGLGFAYALGIQQAFLDGLPPGLRRQAFGLNVTGAMGGQGLTPPAAGELAALAGTGIAMAAAGAVTILAALTLHGLLSGRRIGRSAPLWHGLRAPRIGCGHGEEVR